MMNKLMVLVAIALVGSMAFVAQSHADDCMPWAWKELRPASDWNQCKEVGFIASEVADMRDHKLPQSEAAIQILQTFPSLQGVSLDQINRQYVAPVYESPGVTEGHLCGVHEYLQG
jgi:hypothetical protein